MFDKSIAYKLSIYISLAVIGVFIAFIFITYFFNRKNLKESIENKAIGLSAVVMMNVEEQLIATREISSNISEQIIFYGQNNHPELLISGIMDKYKFLNAIRVFIDSGVPEIEYHNYFGFRDRDSILFEKRNEKFYYCLNEKRIVEEVSINNSPGWTEVFQCPKNNNMVVSYYSPIKIRNGNTSEIVGGVICELSLLHLNDIVNKIEVGKNGFTFLISKDGLYLTHPNKEWVFKKSVFSLPDNVYNKKKTNIKEVLEKGLSGSLTAYPEMLPREKHWVYYSRIRETEWTLIYAIPYIELFDSLNFAMLRMLFFSILGILIVYIIISFITNKLIEPLSAVTTQLKKFTSLTNEGEIDTSNEVKLVSESLSYLKSWYKKFKIDKSQEEIKNKLQLQDLMQASEIQRSLIKTDFLEFTNNKGIDLFAIYKPSRIVSGDLFDYFFLDEDHLIFTMGDVSGKGVPAAIFMSIAQTIIKNNALFKDASAIVRKANNELHTTNNHQFFLTLFLGILNTKTGLLKYCNAAHTPSYILKLNGDIIELNKSHGLPLGLYANKSYSDSKITLEKGDSIVLYTDGITELQNEKRIHFGSERFVENLRYLIGSEPKILVERIERSLEIYRGEAKQVDDITLMTIKYNS